jgi:hypothetical protein
MLPYAPLETWAGWRCETWRRIASLGISTSPERHLASEAEAVVQNGTRLDAEFAGATPLAQAYSSLPHQTVTHGTLEYIRTDLCSQGRYYMLAALNLCAPL